MVKLANPTPNTKSCVCNPNDCQTDGCSRALIRNVAWAALEKVAGKEKNVDELPQGTSHSVSLNIAGEIDGKPFNQQLQSVVNIGFEQSKSSSVNPQVPALVAYILSKLNRATRNRVLTDIPIEFAENDNQLPETRPVLVEEARHLLKKLRTQKQITARGAVRCEYTL